MPPDEVRLAAAVQRTIDRATRSAWPKEMVGALGGTHRDGTVLVEHVVPIAAAGQRDSFAVTPTAFLLAEAELTAAGHQWLGFVHSHPGGTAAPSARDRRELWHRCLQLIVGGPRPDELQTAAFWLEDDACAPLRLGRCHAEARASESAG